jgi:hypothetical protein
MKKPSERRKIRAGQFAIIPEISLDSRHADPEEVPLDLVN